MVCGGSSSGGNGGAGKSLLMASIARDDIDMLLSPNSPEISPISSSEMSKAGFLRNKIIYVNKYSLYGADRLNSLPKLPELRREQKSHAR